MKRDRKKEKYRYEGSLSLGKASTPYKIGQVINYTLLLLLGIATLYPFYYAFILSLNEGQDAMRGGIYLLPRVVTLENFRQALRHPLIFSSFGISVARTLVSVILSCFFTSLLGYAMTKRDLPGRSLIIFYFFFTTLFSGGLIPNFIVYRQLGLLNNFWIYVLPGIYSFFNAIIFRTFFYSIPASLQESARIDGCSELKIYFRIMLPLSLPVLAAIALFVGVGNWNDWFTGTYFVSRRRDLWPAATLLHDIISAAAFEIRLDPTTGISHDQQQRAREIAETTTPESLKMAFLILLTAPIVLIYPFLQKYFVKGVLIGSIKE